MSSGDSITALRQSNEHLRALIRFITSVIDIDSVEEILWLLTDQTIADLGFEDCVVYLVDPLSHKLVQKAAYGNKNPSSHEILNPIELDFGVGLVGRCAQQQRTVLINDLREDPAYVVDDAVRQSELAVPIMDAGRTIGVIDSEHSSPHFYTAHHVATLQAIATIISTKYANTRAFADLEKSIAHLERARMLQKAVFDIAELVYTTSTVDAFYARLHELISSLISADAFFICLLDDSRNCLTFPYFHDAEVGRLFDIEVDQARFGSSLAARVVLSGRALLLQREELEGMVANQDAQQIGSVPWSWLGVPFETSEGEHGAVAIQNHRSQTPFTNDDQDLLKYVSQQISMAIKRKGREADLHYRALHDQLTDLANRTLFQDRLEHALERHKRDPGNPVSVMFLDLDGFKQVNDQHGHLAGDALIREVGQRVLGCLRTTDTLARLGGDEFAILVEDAGDDADLRGTATRVVDSLLRPFKYGNASLYISASLGIARASQGCDTASTLLQRADEAMYRAKALGKGQFVFSDNAIASATNTDA